MSPGVGRIVSLERGVTGSWSLGGVEGKGE